MKTRTRLLISAILCAIFTLSMLFCAPRASSEDAAPRYIKGSEVKPGDCVVIVAKNYSVALSEESSGNRLAPVSVRRSGSGSEKTLAQLPANIARLTVESSGTGTRVYLRGESGYLTSAPTGNGLYWSYSPEPCSEWLFEGDGFLYNPNSAYEHGGTVYRNDYLEYYPNSNAFTTYGKSNDSTYFELEFYLVEKEITREGGNETAGGEFRLPVFETSDIHGYVADVSGSVTEYRLAYIADKVSDVRGTGEAYDKSLALLLDGGDIYQGNTLSNLLQGQSVSAAFYNMGYDAVTIGNHEFDWGIENTVDADATMIDFDLGEGKKTNDIPVTVSNIWKDGAKVTFAKEYVIVTKTARSSTGEEISVKIGIIGFAGEYASSIMKSKFTGAGYTVRSDYDALNKLAKELESSGKCDVTVMLTHDVAQEQAENLGRNTVIDLVLGGHSHQSESGKVSSGVTYIQPAAYGQAYCYCELVFESNGSGAQFSRVANASVRNVTGNSSVLDKNSSSSQGQLNEETVAITDVCTDLLADVLAENIGYINVSAMRHVYLYGSGDRSTTAGTWMSSIIARSVGADVGFVNSGGIRLSFEIEKGKKVRYITASDVYTMFPFSNTIYLYELTYNDLLTLLEYSLTSNGRTLVSEIWGIDCYYVGNYVSAIVKDGVPVYVNGAWKPGCRDKTLKVAVSEYLATSERSDGRIANPLIAWNSTDRLLEHFITDNEGALAVLREEGASGDGLLYIDSDAHYIASAYVDRFWYLSNDGKTLTISPKCTFGDAENPPPYSELSENIERISIQNGITLIPAGAFDGFTNVKEVVFDGTANEWNAITIEDELLSSSREVTVTCSDRSFKSAAYICEHGDGHVFEDASGEASETGNGEHSGDSEGPLTCVNCGTVFENMESVPGKFSRGLTEMDIVKIVIASYAALLLLCLGTAALLVILNERRLRKG
ncbi:MAG: 5'-nucleotidase C-terminal domain-containing protein [Clostridia bacterium]|nr:5'-nucleotidase C-terminal domain-containing protein [Clostridia bacterium]